MPFPPYIGFIGGIFVKLHTTDSERMRYKRSRRGCGRSIIKGTFLIQKSVFLYLYFLSLEEFS